MSNLIYSYNAPLVIGPEQGDLVEYGEVGGRFCYLCAAARNDGGVLEAEHDPVTGAPVTQGPLYADLFPIGNIAGFAPADVRHHHWQGHDKRLYQDPDTATGDPQFPADDQPDSVEIRRWEFGDGWGVRVELIYGSDPTNKAIARYLDEDYTQFHYTTGAFVLQDSYWQVDENDNPVQVYATETPPGFRTTQQEPEYIGLWFGQLVAKSPLPLGTDTRTAYYFTHNIGDPSGGWVDTGATTTGMAGTVILVSDGTPFALKAGAKVRVGATGREDLTIGTLWPSAASPQGFETAQDKISAVTGLAVYLWE